MKAREKDLEEFVGKTVSDCGSESVFRCVGYNLITGLLIMDAGKDGWRDPGIGDVLGIVGIECESFWYLSPLTARIIK